MLNRIKLFFGALKLLLDFLKELLSHSDIQVNGDSNSVTTNTYNNVQIDNSKSIHKDTTKNITVNKHFPTCTVNISDSSSDNGILNAITIFVLLLLSNNFLLYPYYFIFKVVIILLILAVVVCSLHVLLLSPNKIINKIYFAVIAIISFYNLAIFLKFIPKQVTIADIFCDTSYIVALIYTVSLIVFSLAILIEYAKDMIAISRTSSDIFPISKTSIIYLIFPLFLHYLYTIMNTILGLLN